MLHRDSPSTHRTRGTARASVGMIAGALTLCFHAMPSAAQTQPTPSPGGREAMLEELRRDPAVIRLKRTLLFSDLDYLRTEDSKALAAMKQRGANVAAITAAHTQAYHELEQNAQRLYGSPPEPGQAVCAGLYGLGRHTWTLKAQAQREPGTASRTAARQAEQTFLQQRTSCAQQIKAARATPTPP